jgi:hypothetical protein
MSIVAYVFTPEGFAVGGDARRGRNHAGQIEKSDLRRLIRLQSKGVDLVCGWTDITQIPCEEGTFDLSARMEMIGDALPQELSGTQYVEKFFDELSSRFDDELRVVLRASESKGLFLGYVQEASNAAWLPRCWQWDLNQADDPVEQALALGYHVTAGPDAARLPDPVSLQEGEAGLRTYMKTCLQNSSQSGNKFQILTAPRPGAKIL